MRRRHAIGLGAVALLTGCAGPPLRLYTLSLPPSAGPEAALTARPQVIAVSRISLQSDIDGTDLILRDGSTLRRSLSGRWASRLSVAMTDRLTQLLAARYPRALVTSSPMTSTPTALVRINVTRLDIGVDGSAVMDADWVVVPANTRQPERQQRIRIALQGSVATDADLVALTGALVDRLASAIVIGPLG